MRKILVADDEADLEILIRQKFRQKIREQQYEFVFAINGQDALEKMQLHPDVSIVLSDINMPEMDGLTVLENLRAQDKTSRLPVILITGEADAKSIARGRALGAQDYLCKPYKIAELMTRIDRCLLACT